jgi:membrane-associated protein
MRLGVRLVRRCTAGRTLPTAGVLRADPRLFDRYGNKALVLGRFVPVVRTFVTVVAGVSGMSRRRFFTWSLVGAVLWASGVTALGYVLGGVEFLQRNIEVVLLLVVAVSLLPALVEWVRHRRRAASSVNDRP